jgi:uncharacterized protein YjbI with pentapeptide repeats
MKVVKPLRLGVLTKPFERDRRYFLSIAVVTFFPFDQPDRLLPEVSLWKLSGELLGPEGILDECMPKATAEVLVAGSAFPPSPPQAHCRVRLAMGPVDRTIYVFGDREWERLGPTDPKPFSEMPLAWSKAFGGAAIAKNPLGKGAKAEFQTLPNLEDPKALVRSPDDQPDPACWMPIPLWWPQRMAKSGTYDQAWLETQYPGYPLDFDWSFFQAAHEGQRFPGFLKGGEAFSIENMHREKPALTSRLPLGRGRCIAVREAHGKRETHDLTTRIDTVWLFPNQARGAVIHRAVMEVAEDDAADVVHLLCAYELPDQPKPLAHYEEALADRLDPQAALAAMLRDKDLLPELPPKGEHADDELSDMDRLLRVDNLMVENARRGAERQLEDARRRATEAFGAHLPGPPLVLPSLPPRAPAPTLDELPEVIEEAMATAANEVRKVQTRADQAEADARALCEQQGLDYDKLMADAQERELKRRRRYSAKEQLDHLQATATLAENAGMDATSIRATLADPQLVEKLVSVETAMNDVYRSTAHLLPATRAEPDAYTREELAAGAREGRTFAGRDLTNADLSGLDLTGIDLEGAFLEGADLRGAILNDANLARAILAHADLTGASLEGTNLTDANIGKAVIDGASLRCAVLERTSLSTTTLRRTRLQGARLSSTQLFDVSLEEVDLSEATLDGLMAFRVKLTAVKLAGATVTRSTFMEPALSRVDFRGASLRGVNFVTAKGDHVIFDEADLGSARFVKECSFTSSTFVGARMKRANFRGALLAEADLRGALLDDADLSEADLTGAKLDRVHANDALFIRTKLSRASAREGVFMQSIFQKARVEGADFGDANLFRADALNMRGDAETNLKGAFVKRVRFTAQGRRG